MTPYVCLFHSGLSMGAPIACTQAHAQDAPSDMFSPVESDIRNAPNVSIQCLVIGQTT